jgi:hypothetical protein
VKPYFKTIARLPAQQSRRIRAGFFQFVLCRRLGLFGRELLALDGTRIKAVNNNYRNSERRSLAKFICRPAPMKISTRRAGASSSVTSLRSEIDMYRSTSTLRTSSQPNPQKATGSRSEVRS